MLRSRVPIMVAMVGLVLTMMAADAFAAKPSYTLTVVSGTGDGEYTRNTIVPITADAPPTGQVFDQWTGDVTNVADVNASSTTIEMPGGTTTVTATYGAPTYTLTVVSGTGDGSYTQGAVVAISADAAPTGQQFSAWTGDTSGIDNVNNASANLTVVYPPVKPSLQRSSHIRLTVYRCLRG